MYDSKKCFMNSCYEVNVHYNFCVSVVVFEVIESYCVVCHIMSHLGTEGLSLLLLICIAWFMLVIGQQKKINTSHRPFAMYHGRHWSPADPLSYTTPDTGTPPDPLPYTTVDTVLSCRSIILCTADTDVSCRYIIMCHIRC